MPAFHPLVRIEIWSDLVCPWCYVGKRRLEAALRRFEGAAAVEVRWRAFELDPGAPARRERAYADHLAHKYRVPVDEAARMIDRMTATAANVGLTYRFDIARPGNTFDAHRLTALAADRGVQDAVVERLFRGAFTEGEPVGDRHALVRMAAEAGLDEADAAATLDSDAYADEVRDDERTAAALGIAAVPFFVVDRAYGVAGAQSPEVILDVLRQAGADAEAAAR